MKYYKKHIAQKMKFPVKHFFRNYFSVLSQLPADLVPFTEIFFNEKLNENLIFRAVTV